MHDLGNFVLNLAMVIAAAWIVNQFWRSFFQKKEKSFLSVTVWILYCIFQILRQCNRGNINLPGTFIHILLILIILPRELVFEIHLPNHLHALHSLVAIVPKYPDNLRSFVLLLC